MQGSPTAPTTQQAPRRRRNDLTHALGSAPGKKKRIPTCTDPDHVVSRGFNFFDVKVILTKNPTTGAYSENAAFVMNESGKEDYRAKVQRQQELERYMGGETIGG